VIRSDSDSDGSRSVQTQGHEVSARGSGFIQFITGPNSSGKSVYLRQVGTIVYLAHVGCFVPAQAARIGTVDKILSRAYTSDTVASMLSTFANDASQMAYMLRHCTSNSLLLMDEFGKGTATSDGISLLAATLEKLDAMPQPPRVFGKIL
jgi:DNA mismatch repair protein MSH5